MQAEGTVDAPDATAYIRDTKQLAVDEVLVADEVCGQPRRFGDDSSAIRAEAFPGRRSSPPKAV